MSEFSQLSTKICTLHCLNQDGGAMRAELARCAPAKPPVLVIPCLASEFTDCDLSGIAIAASRQTGYVITDHFLQLTGLCARCAATRQSATEE